MSGRFSCGDLLFDDSHHLSKVLVQKQSLTCESDIEKGYYNHKDRRLKLDDICIHCGELGSDKFLLKTKQLQERCVSDGYKFHPICTACLYNNKIIVHIGRKDQVQAKKEKAKKAELANAAPKTA